MSQFTKTQGKAGTEELLNFFVKVVCAMGYGFATAVLMDLYNWCKTPGGWKQTGFDFQVASKRWVVGALSGLITATGLHLQN